MKEKLTGIESLKPDSTLISVGMAWAILLVALTVTAVYSYSTKQSVEENARKDFSFECNEIMGSVHARLHAHAALLRTGAAFIESRDTVSRKEWEIFISNQKTEKNLPGVQGLGYAIIVSGKKLIEHELHIRNSGFPDYKIKPEGKREIYTSIIYIEPFTGRNLQAFGYDMFSEPVRREAMEKARDLNIASLSGKVKLVQESNTDIQAGTLMYVPVYRQGMPISTVAERRRAIKGWSYSPYRMNDFMSGVLGNYQDKLKGRIRMQIYDNDSVIQQALLFDSQSVQKIRFAGSAAMKLLLPVDFKGKHWTLYFSKNMERPSFYLYKEVILVLFGGIAISLLIFILALLLIKNRSRLELTTLLARNLKENLDKHIALYNAIPDAVFVSDSKTGKIEEINHKALEQYGYTHDEFVRLTNPDIKFQKSPPENSEVLEQPFLQDQYHKKKDSTVFPVEISTSTFEYDTTQKIIAVVRDITERKLAEESLRESEEKWRSLVSNSPDYIALHDKDGKYLFLNHFAEGFSEKDIVGHSIYEFLAPGTTDLFRLKYNESISSWRPVKFEHTALGNNGEMRVYEESFVPVLTKNEEVNVLAIAKDITEQKLAERKLQEREEHFRLIFEDGSIAMALVNADFRFTQVNKAFVALLGYSEAELKNMTFADISDPEYIEQDIQQVQRLLNHEIALYHTEKKYITKFKKKVWGLVQVSVMYNKAGEFISLLVMINNINERKSAEESLLESQEIFNQFMLNSPIYVFFKDKQIRSLRLSRNFEQMLGRPLDELLGKTMDDIFPSALAKKMIADDISILNNGKQTDMEEEMNGRYYSTTKFPIYIEGKPMYLAGYSIDITSRKLAGDTIKAALHEKEILLREVHHRVKNNLQVVSSLLNLQANKITDKSIKEILEQSRNRIRSIALVHEKLYQTGNFAEINIKEYTRSLVTELFRVYLADPQKIHISTQIVDINIPLVYAIPYGLILNEIISNSLKYAFPKDRVTKQKPEIFIKLKTLPDKYLQISIGDNGIGLPEDYAITDSLSLGLYLIRILATEQLDGEIEIDNKKGTIFTIAFNPYPVYDKK
jgi:PAS domain S-box-containing protein